MEVITIMLLVGQTDRVVISPYFLLGSEPLGLSLLLRQFRTTTVPLWISLIHGGVGMGVGLFSEILTFHLHEVLMNHGQTFESEIQWYDVFTG